MIGQVKSIAGAIKLAHKCLFQKLINITFNYNS